MVDDNHKRDGTLAGNPQTSPGRRSRRVPWCAVGGRGWVQGRGNGTATKARCRYLRPWPFALWTSLERFSTSVVMRLARRLVSAAVETYARMRRRDHLCLVR